jgi:hypothetical protein
MGFDLPVFISAGIQDALSPMQLGVAGIYAVMMISLRRCNRVAAFVAGGLFIGVQVVLGVILSLELFGLASVVSGLADQISWLLVVLGVFFVVLGILFWREWRCLSAGRLSKFAAFIPVLSLGVPAALLLSLFLAAVLACVSSLWPVNYQVLLQVQMAFTPGRFYYSLGALSLYVLFRSIPALCVFLFFILAERRENAAFLRGKASLISVIASAFFFAVGGSLFFFCYVAAIKPWF